MQNRASSLSYKLCKNIAKVPGIVDSYVTFNDLTGSTPVCDSAWRHLDGWLKDIERQKGAPADLEGKRLLFFSVLPFHVDYSLALAMLLLARGAQVDFAWLPHATYGSQAEPTIGYPFWLRSARKFKDTQPHDRLRLIDLTEIAPCGVTAEMHSIAARQALTDTSYVMLKESVKVDSNPMEKAEYLYCLDRNLDALSRVRSLCQNNDYDRMVLINGAILEFGALYNFVAKMDIPTSTFEAQNNGTIIVSHGATVMGMDSSDLWSQDEPHVLTDARRSRVQALINARQKPAENGVTLDAFQLAGVVPDEETRRQLGIKSEKPVVLICPNCPFDAAYFVEGKRHFTTMVDWLTRTIRHFIDKTDCEVIVRCHPAERYYQTVENTVNIIHDAFGDLPEHIRVVKPEDPVSTYSIMNITDLGLIYWSTTGLEMTMRGIPVVSGVPCLHYNGKGFTLDPDTQEEYFEIIEKVVSSPYRLTSRQIELSWSYADVYFNDWPQPFPWGLGRRFWQDLQDWPVSRMISPEGEARYGRTIRNLMGIK